MYTNLCAVEQRMFLEVLTILVFSRSDLFLEDFNLPSLDVIHNNDYIFVFLSREHQRDLELRDVISSIPCCDQILLS